MSEPRIYRLKAGYEYGPVMGLKKINEVEIEVVAKEDYDQLRKELSDAKGEINRLVKDIEFVIDDLGCENSDCYDGFTNEKWDHLLTFIKKQTIEDLREALAKLRKTEGE